MLLLWKKMERVWNLVLGWETFVTFSKESFDGGFNIDWVKDSNGAPLKYTTNMTMMRVDLPQPIKVETNLNFLSSNGIRSIIM